LDQHAGQIGVDQHGNRASEAESASGRGGPRLVLPLKAAIRRARVENAEQSEALDIVHGAEIARLEFLHDALGPILEEVPEDVDIFDVSLATSGHPRLFIDMIAFVEMGHDKRLYRFLQDTRHGRIIVAEHEKISVIVEAVTTYIARRLVEREKMLATIETPAPAAPKRTETKLTGEPPAAPATTRFKDIMHFSIDLLGSMLLFILIAAGVYFLLTWWSANGPDLKF